MVISNTGGGTLQITSITPSGTWLTVSPVSANANGVGRYLVTVSRLGMAEGTYSAQIDIVSNAGNTSVPVMIQVSNTPMPSNLGVLYILLVNPDTDTVVGQTAVRANNGSYSFSINNVAAGTYELVAGSDNDSDSVICDGGEACGGYITFEQRTPITVDGNESGMDFTAGYDVAVTTQSVGSKRREYRRLQ
jgi:serine protease